MRKLLKKNTSENDVLLNRFPSRSGYAESYRTLRTNLQFTSMDRDLKTICVTSATETENLFLMPSGKIPPNPSEMISSRKMMFVLDNLSALFDFVILDTPPVLPASDALMIAPKTDGILMVVKANAVNKKYIKDALGQIESSATKILGLILNRVDINKERYYRYYRKYYSSYYGKTQ